MPAANIGPELQRLIDLLAKMPGAVLIRRRARDISGAHMDAATRM